MEDTDGCARAEAVYMLVRQRRFSHEHKTSRSITHLAPALCSISCDTTTEAFVSMCCKDGTGHKALPDRNILVLSSELTDSEMVSSERDVRLNMLMSGNMASGSVTMQEEVIESA